MSTQGPTDDASTPGAKPESEPAESSGKSWREWADGQLDSLNTEAAPVQPVSVDAVPAAAQEQTSGSPAASAAPQGAASQEGVQQPPARVTPVQQQHTGGRGLAELVPKSGTRASVPGSGAPRPGDRAAVVDILSQPRAGVGKPETSFASYGLLAQATDAPRTVYGNKAEEQSPSRVHPFRLFFPGQTYGPEDLDPYRGAPEELGRPTVKQAAAIPATVVLARADFRDAGFLSSFITETGRLIPRRRTKLSAKLHKHVARQVKTARAMGILRADAAPARQWSPRRA